MTETEQPEDWQPDAGGERSEETAPENWPESKDLGWAESSEQEMVVYRATLRRIERMIGIAGVLCALAAARPLGWAVSAGMLMGTLLGWINFRWLAASVNAIGERIAKVRSPEGGAAIMARGVGRILLIALIAYGIFACSVRGLMGFLAGLAMPVIAMMCEAVYEFVACYRRSS
jgi:ATP synthase I chain